MVSGESSILSSRSKFTFGGKSSTPRVCAKNAQADIQKCILCEMGGGDMEIEIVVQNRASRSWVKTKVNASKESIEEWRGILSGVDVNLSTEFDKIQLGFSLNGRLHTPSGVYMENQ